MPEFLSDPSVLTKEKLKSELIANNVSLPGGEQRKDVYVQLYLQHLTARNAPGPPAQPDFSSDEERERGPVTKNRAGGGGAAAVSAGRKVTKKTDKPRTEEQDDIDVTELSNEELKNQLLKHGLNPGPIVATTRKLYEKKLLKLKESGQDISSFVATPTVSSSAENSKQNGNDDSDQYSDKEEDPKTEFKLEKREPLKGKIKASVALRQRRTAEHNQVSEKTSTEEKRLERDILKEMFPYEVSTPTGISASCRRPIKGAAGRPVDHGDFRLDEPYSSKYITKYVTSGLSDVKAEKPTVKKRSIPLWIKFLLFIVVAVFLFLVYQCMETNQGNPFSQLIGSSPDQTID
ncbi:thymopoietin isoform X4 [Anolis carolinensis]|uniref:thymopoietin isoform X4 n=1 Tax=Anolis carolinensis TaxID=28377 RepID=UPI002F2B7C94